MKLTNTAMLCALMMVFAAAQCVSPPPNRSVGPESSSARLTACDSQIDLSKEMRVLSTDNWADVERSREALLEQASQSEECRKEIVAGLIRSMNKPELNFIADRPAYFLWLNGSILLGRLKAVEALDLLIEHLDLNDGEFSASMTHQPAVLGVSAMGSAALPKLTVALKENQNRNIRLAAALCLKNIGGASVLPTLRDALESESDDCVRRFLEISLEMGKLEAEAESGHSTKQETATKELRQRLLRAMRCGN